MTYTGKTRIMGVMGYPIAHSLSPVIQNAAIQAAGIDYGYIAMPVAPEALEDAVKGLKALGFIGCNVTIPHKVNIMQYLDEIDETASLIGAVNTVVIKDGKLRGYNTDGIGFITPLLKDGVEVSGKTAVILGAGGACRAVISGLAQRGAANIVLGVRNPVKGQAMADYFTGKIDSHIEAHDWHSDEFAKWLAKADLLINTTPLGMQPNVDAAPPVDWDGVNPQAFVYDIVYVPAMTKFLREAKARGHRILNGERMLAEQGAAALKLWTDADIDVDVMIKALRDFLSTRE